jgi:nucleoside-diphosphate-sugar epimerase
VCRILVTGATGFVGSAIVRRLLGEGHQVLALHGRRAPAIEDPAVEWRRIDLLGASAAELQEVVAGGDATHCIHAAWYTNHADYLVHDVNRDWLAASLRLARAVEAAGARFVGLGTCLEYDVANADGPCVEGVTPLRPDTLYARCKLDLCEALAASGADHAWTRVFFVYGPGDRAGRLIPAMLGQFARGEAAGPTNGGLRRDYVHVDDLAAQLVRIALSPAQGAINTGSGGAPTLAEIYKAGARAMGRPELALANDRTGGQPPLIAADLTRFRVEIGDPHARRIGDGLADLIGSQR